MSYSPTRFARSGFCRLPLPRLPIACLLLVCAQESRAQDTPVLSPPEIVAAAPAGEWVAIAPSDLIVMDLASDAAGHSRRVVIQLLPAPFSQGWIGNIRKLAAAHWWDGTSVNRLQDNYVAQWGDPNSDDKAHARPVPAGLIENSQAAYVAARFALPASAATAPSFGHDAYAPETRIVDGWAVGLDKDHAWPLHCYGMVGVGRDNPPDTGTGAELYAVIGQAPRQLDRNIALVGRVIEGIEWLSSLPRGTGPIGFYKTAAERVPIIAVRNGGDVPGLPGYQMLSTKGQAFARYAAARANRRDTFFVTPAGGVDACNVPVPVRRIP
ncbi:peptidylprolyl isomerase [Novosphingobium sp.]|uniref:peptidylprolyl isomerase n=1 Tax=Novosphingobium sp. TaxID=1874826 RepID=UPI003B52D856